MAQAIMLWLAGMGLLELCFVELAQAL